MDRSLVSFDEVARLIPYTKVHIYRLVEKGVFPRPRKLGTKTVWFKHEIDAYIDALPVADANTAARYRPPARRA
jgi:predicted DNA-binding transcriptional regulator AlpA